MMRDFASLVGLSKRNENLTIHFALRTLGQNLTNKFPELTNSRRIKLFVSQVNHQQKKEFIFFFCRKNRKFRQFTCVLTHKKP